MIRSLLDTDHVTLLERANAIVQAHFTVQASGSIAVSLVTEEEAFSRNRDRASVQPSGR